MASFLPTSMRSKIVRYLLLHWRSDVIAAEVHCNTAIVYNIQFNLFIYDSSCPPKTRRKNASRRVSKAKKNDLIRWLKEQPWAQQSELIWYLWKKWKLHVHRSTIFRILKRKKWNEKTDRRVDERQNKSLRMHWIAELLNVVAKQLMYVDKSLFNETTNWRLRNWAPIDHEKKYHVDRQKDHGWSVLPAYTLNDYLFCTAIKKKWFNEKELYDWIANQLLPHCNAFSAHQSIIIMNNVFIHVNFRIEEMIETHGCQVRYLFSYFLDFNSIEFIFSVLKVSAFAFEFELDNLLTIWKIWIRRHFTEFWPFFDGNFGDWLRYAIRRSKCNTYAKQHFKHSTYGRIIFEVNMQEINRQLVNGEMHLKDAWKKIIIMLHYDASFRCFWSYENCNIIFSIFHFFLFS